jgi:hypothetical protein
MDGYWMRLSLTPLWLYACVLLGIAAQFAAGKFFLERRGKLAQWKYLRTLLFAFSCLQLLSIFYLGLYAGEEIIEQALEEHGVETLATITAVSDRGGFRQGPIHPICLSAQIQYHFADQNGVDTTSSDSEVYNANKNVPWQVGDQIKIIYDPVSKTHSRLAEYIERARSRNQSQNKTQLILGQLLALAAYWAIPSWLYFKGAMKTSQAAHK